MRKRRKSSSKKNIYGIFIIIFTLCIMNISNNINLFNTTNSLENNVDNNKETIEEESTIALDEMLVHYIDVGQGDSIFIELPNGETMLIDAGESNQGQIVEQYIKSLKYNKITYLIGTHPHTDHIGGLEHIIKNLEIEQIYMPKVASTSKTYENLLNTISSKKLKIKTAKSGVNILNSSSLTIDIIAPVNTSYTSLNNYSAVIKINYLNISFLFMGDAETKSENEITADLQADVIKVGHHGSDTASSQTFVNKVRPKYAIISVGTDNKYEHPNDEVVNRWTNIGAKVYQTNIVGNIIISTDGKNIEINTSKEGGN